MVFDTCSIYCADPSVCLTDVQVSLLMLRVLIGHPCRMLPANCLPMCMFQGTYLQWDLKHEGLRCTDTVELAHMFDAT